MIAAILNFIFIILLAVFIIAGVVAFKIYRTIHSVKKQFNTFRGKDNGNTARQQYRQTSTEDEIIIDRRSPDEMNRKIFSKSEGEYVDFEEEK